MPPERFPPDDPREWLNRARSNLVQAKHRSEGVYLEDLCFQAQQAAEKALKAVLIHRGIEFPYVHDLGELIHRLEAGGIELSDRIRGCARLTEFAVASRYPGVGEPVTEEEYLEGVQLAEDVLQWSAGKVGYILA